MIIYFNPYIFILHFCLISLTFWFIIIIECWIVGGCGLSFTHGWPCFWSLLISRWYKAQLCHGPSLIIFKFIPHLAKWWCWNRTLHIFFNILGYSIVKPWWKYECFWLLIHILWLLVNALIWFEILFRRVSSITLVKITAVSWSLNPIASWKCLELYYFILRITQQHFILSLILFCCFWVECKFLI